MPGLAFLACLMHPTGAVNLAGHPPVAPGGARGLASSLLQGGIAVLYPRSQARWKTRFGSWVSRTSVPKIVAELGRDPDLAVTPKGVYSWLAGRNRPSPRRAEALEAMSRGEISLQDIYGHQREMAHVENREQHGDEAR